MAKYSVKFEIEVIVDEPFNIGSNDEVLYNENGVQTISDQLWNDIVSDAIDQMEDIGNNVTEIVKLNEEED